MSSCGREEVGPLGWELRGVLSGFLYVLGPQINLRLCTSEPFDITEQRVTLLSVGSFKEARNMANLLQLFDFLWD